MGQQSRCVAVSVGCRVLVSDECRELGVPLAFAREKVIALTRLLLGDNGCHIDYLIIAILAPKYGHHAVPNVLHGRGVNEKYLP